MARYDFNNKVVWVTGASSGIGAELVVQLNQLGAFVIASARREERLIELKDRLSYSENYLPIQLDLIDGNSISNAVEVVRERGSLDLLIHNAGIAQKGMVIENDMEVDRRIMETNYFGTIQLTKEVLPLFCEQGYGWFGVVTSIAGVVGVPGRSAYSASKHALHGFFDSLRAESFACDLQVSVIMPGFIHTHITVKELKGDGTPYGKVEKSHRLGMSPEDCARKIIRGLKRRKRNIVVGKMEVMSIYIQRFSPSLYDFLVRHHPVKKWRAFLRIIGINKG